MTTVPVDTQRREGTGDCPSGTLPSDRWTPRPTARQESLSERAWMRVSISRIGYLSYDAHAADLLCQVVSRRYEQKSIVLI
jgi:hypothetical protein